VTTQQKTNSDRIAVILPTYNGAAFLEKQILSIINQKNVETKIYIRDDWSSDETYEIAKSLSSTFKNIILLRGKNRGIVENIDYIFKIIDKDSKYFALADQDDVWHPNKLHSEMEKMVELENRYGVDLPILICSDAHCINEEDKIIAKSFFKESGIPSWWGNSMKELLVLSHGLGCSFLGNRTLQTIALPLPSSNDIFMHDWWIMLVAMFFGKIHCIHETLLDYRQHKNNVFGIRSTKSLLQKLHDIRINTRKTQKQAMTFLHRYESVLTNDQKKILCEWGNMPESPLLLRLWQCWKHGFRKPGLHFLFT
jgi:rhamnosyltransferase